MTHSTAYKTALALNLPDELALGIDSVAAKVRGFHTLYNVPVGPDQNKDPKFRHMDNPRVGLRLGLIVEELKELFEDGFGVRMDITFSTTDCRGRQAPFNENAMKSGKVLNQRDSDTKEPFDCRNGAEVADALGDLVYVIYGFALELGYNLDNVIDEIHASNLTKLGEDGKPIYREDGKVLKGPNYVKPNIPAALGWEES